MRRLGNPLLALALSSFTLAARADDAPPDPSVPATVSPATAAVSAPVAAPEGRAVTEEDPLRLAQLFRGEADRAHATRISGAVLGALGSAGIVVAGAYFASSDAANTSTVYKTYGYAMVVVGGVTAGLSLLALFSRSSMERLADAYQPIAEDTSVSPALRLARGEEALRAMAESEKSARVVSGITSIVTGVVLGGLGVWFGLSTDLRDSDRVLFATLSGVSGLTVVGSGIAQLTFQRGSTEIALEHWDAARGAARVSSPAAASPNVSLSPLLAPVAGGAIAGVSAVF